MPKNKEEPHLKVYADRSILITNDGREEIFKEGKLTPATKMRLEKIRGALESGFLKKLILECRDPSATLGDLPTFQLALIEKLVDSVTSEVGRGLVGLTVLQLSIKSISPDQSIRLHKGGKHGGAAFSWQEGIPMRVLDKNYNTPILREYDLLRLNADGAFMTRSLAENYPYTILYKAALRGGRNEWLEIVDLVEAGKMDPTFALRHLIALLINRSANFLESANAAILAAQEALASAPSFEEILPFISNFVDSSAYSARVFEVAMHSLFQVLEDRGVLEGYLKPLSQMRSANKKHGNIGDIEVTIGHSTLQILEAWDAKYGKQYLRDELEELNEKLSDHSETKLLGFVTDKAPNLKEEILDRVRELEELHSVKISLLEFDTWAREQIARAGNDEDAIAREWLLAFSESLCQKRRDRAPIDEPSDVWVAQLHGALLALRDS